MLTLLDYFSEIPSITIEYNRIEKSESSSGKKIITLHLRHRTDVQGSQLVGGKPIEVKNITEIMACEDEFANIEIDPNKKTVSLGFMRLDVALNGSVWITKIPFAKRAEQLTRSRRADAISALLIKEIQLDWLEDDESILAYLNAAFLVEFAQK